VTSPAARAALDLTADLPVSDLEDLYRDLHRHPELSLQEHRTAGRFAERLKKAGYETAEGIGGTGVVGVLRNGLVVVGTSQFLQQVFVGLTLVLAVALDDTLRRFIHSSWRVRAAAAAPTEAKTA